MNPLKLIGTICVKTCTPCQSHNSVQLQHTDVMNTLLESVVLPVIVVFLMSNVNETSMYMLRNQGRHSIYLRILPYNHHV